MSMPTIERRNFVWIQLQWIYLRHVKCDVWNIKLYYLSKFNYFNVTTEPTINFISFLWQKRRQIQSIKIGTIYAFFFFCRIFDVKKIRHQGSTTRYDLNKLNAVSIYSILRLQRFILFLQSTHHFFNLELCKQKFERDFIFISKHYNSEDVCSFFLSNSYAMPILLT